MTKVRDEARDGLTFILIGALREAVHRGEELGHSFIRMTADTYGRRRLTTDRQAAADVMGAVFRADDVSTWTNSHQYTKSPANCSQLPCTVTGRSSYLFAQRRLSCYWHAHPGASLATKSGGKLICLSTTNYLSRALGVNGQLPAPKVNHTTVIRAGSSLRSSSRDSRVPLESPIAHASMVHASGRGPAGSALRACTPPPSAHGHMAHRSGAR